MSSRKPFVGFEADLEGRLRKRCKTATKQVNRDDQDIGSEPGNANDGSLFRRLRKTYMYTPANKGDFGAAVGDRDFRSEGLRRAGQRKSLVANCGQSETVTSGAKD